MQKKKQNRTLKNCETIFKKRNENTKSEETEREHTIFDVFDVMIAENFSK